MLTLASPSLGEIAALREPVADVGKRGDYSGTATNATHAKNRPSLRAAWSGRHHRYALPSSRKSGDPS